MIFECLIRSVKQTNTKGRDPYMPHKIIFSAIFLAILAFTGFCIAHNNSLNLSKKAQSITSIASAKTIISPLPDYFEVTNPMADGSYAVSFSVENLTKTASGYNLIVDIYADERFVPSSIDKLKVNDYIKIKNKPVLVESIEKDNINNTIKINEKLDNGGFYLKLQDNYYYAATFDNSPIYEHKGRLTIPISKEVTILDCSDYPISLEKIDYDSLPDGVLGYYDDLPSHLKNNNKKWVATNTSITIRGGEIVQIIREWTP